MLFLQLPELFVRNSLSACRMVDARPIFTFLFRTISIIKGVFFMNFKHLMALAAGVAFASPLTAQTDLSKFDSTVDSWSGSIVGNTPYPNGFTAVTWADESGNGVLNLSDGGFGGGASRTYTGAATSAGFITISAKMKIVSESAVSTLVDTMGFGAKIGSGTGTQGDLAYSRSVGTSADDSGQGFTQVAVALTVPSAGSDMVTVVTPDRTDWSISGTWAARLDDVIIATPGSLSSLDTFDSDAPAWSAISASNSPWAAGSTAVTWTTSNGGSVQISDAGFGGGAVGVYTGAISGPGIHTAVVDLKITADPGTLTGELNGAARVAAAPGATTTLGALSWSQSFATTADDSGQVFASYAVPVITSGASDLAIYVVPDFDASVSGGTWSVEVDNVRLYSGQAVPVSVSSFSID